MLDFSLPISSFLKFKNYYVIGISFSLNVNFLLKQMCFGSKLKGELLRNEEIVAFDVLPRVLAKDLSRMKCVSKCWFRLISFDPHLIRLHSQYSNSLTCLLDQEGCDTAFAYPDKTVCCFPNLYWQVGGAFSRSRPHAMGFSARLSRGCGWICWGTSHQEFSNEWLMKRILNLWHDENWV